MKSAISLALLLVPLPMGPATAQQVASTPPTTYQRAIAAGYKAAMICSGVFNAGRTPAQIEADELAGIYPDYAPILPTLPPAAIDRTTHSVTVAFDDKLPPRQSDWRPGTGCTTMPIGSRVRPLFHPHAPQPGPAAADPRPWPLGDAGIAPRPSPALASTVANAFDDDYGEGAKTVGVVILRDGHVVAERYSEGFGPFVANRTWSVAKSIAGTLVGLAGMNTTSTAGIYGMPGFDSSDPRSGISVDHLLRMASGLHSDTAGNRTDAIYFGGTAVDEQAMSWPLEAAPGARFRYANNDILLAMRAVRRSLGEERHTFFPKASLFLPLGMANTIAERDWHGNYILSSQVWSTARDLARLGQFWLQDGVWEGKRLLPAGWMAYMTAPSGPQPESGPGYGATLWLFGPKQGLPAGSYAAQGNRGQYVMVIPSRRLVIVRRGEDPGPARFDIARFAADVVAATQ
ncbi:serine hydrolase domain-containing protein [Sphingomonas rubra]|uniref:CubicO group peptidase, beta-lactamase class C family n=1 Tax=Sphingomonas rubra TaxID=634430 RepID=A0A1I5RT42_9SPHN|nr:serine hydrolase [Sphingomonas rubra]SFP61663.1 CubicO group peptidase, beta-lactamase class C family [Sphingomonas rubra]